MPTPTTSTAALDPRPCAGRHRGQADACTGAESCGLPFATHRGDAPSRAAGVAWGLGHGLALSGSAHSTAISIGTENQYDPTHVEAGWRAGVAERAAEREAKVAVRKSKAALFPLRRLIELAGQAMEAVANDDPATARATMGDALKRAVEAMNVLGRFPVVVVGREVLDRYAERCADLASLAETVECPGDRPDCPDGTHKESVHRSPTEADEAAITAALGG